MLLLSRPFQRHFDSDAKAWKAAVTGAGGSVSIGRLGAVSALISALKNGGVWSNLDRLWLLAAENSQQALVDLVARASATAVNAPAFTANRGYQGNGTSSWIDSGFNAATAGGNFSQNDASWGVWVETAASSGCLIGNDNGTYSRLQVGASNSREVSIVGSVGGPAFNATDPTGFVHCQRLDSTTVEGYDRTGLKVSNNTITSSPSSSWNRNVGILCVNYTAPGLFFSGRLSHAHIGKSMSAAQIAALNNAMRAYMTAVGVA